MPKSVTIARPSRDSRMLPGLHVAMDDAANVGDAERARDVEADPSDIAGRQPSAAPQSRREVLALDQLHDEIRLAVVRAGLQAGDDVPVAQDRRREGLAPEAHRDVGVRDDLAAEQLDRHEPPEPGVERAMDGRHPAGADDLGQAVPAVDDPARVGRVRTG